MQNAAFTALGIDCRYVASETTDARRAIDQLRASGTILGANVTIPLKESVIPFLDGFDDAGKRIGAVNTIVKREGTLVGCNTDVIGFQRALDECGYNPIGRRVALIGAGGAARAVAQVLRPSVARFVVIARRPEQALGLIDALALGEAETLPFEHLADGINAADLVVNATPLDIPETDSLRAEHRLFDLRYRHSLEGRAMLLHQGAAAFEIWTGQAAPLETMREALHHAAEAVPV
jgi:shikimate dehydrogenase